MNEFFLMRPLAEHADAITDYRREMLEANSSMDGCGPLRGTESAADYIRLCREYENPITVPAHLVPATQFLFFRRTDNRLIGMIQIRHTLNDYLAAYGGHIGYSVRPSERRKGYAKAMLHAALDFCREIGLTNVLITCIDGNIGSEKTIRANGGVYESTVHESTHANAYLKRFWIAL